MTNLLSFLQALTNLIELYAEQILLSLVLLRLIYHSFLFIEALLFQAVHNFFKERMKFLVTDTVDGPDSSSKCIRVRLNSGSNSGRGRNSRKRKDRDDRPYDSRGSDSSWPENLGKFLR